MTRFLFAVSNNLATFGNRNTNYMKQQFNKKGEPGAVLGFMERVLLERMEHLDRERGGSLFHPIMVHIPQGVMMTDPDDYNESFLIGLIKYEDAAKVSLFEADDAGGSTGVCVGELSLRTHGLPDENIYILEQVLKAVGRPVSWDVTVVVL